VAGFIMASLIGGYFQFDGGVTSLFSLISKSLFGLALVLIGSQMSLESLKTICPRLSGMALVLWSALSISSLYWVTTV
jgi:uncharacterized membrane protein YadS